LSCDSISPRSGRTDHQTRLTAVVRSRTATAPGDPETFARGRGSLSVVRRGRRGVFSRACRTRSTERAAARPGLASVPRGRVVPGGSQTSRETDTPSPTTSAASSTRSPTAASAAPSWNPCTARKKKNPATTAWAPRTRFEESSSIRYARVTTPNNRPPHCCVRALVAAVGRPSRVPPTDDRRRPPSGTDAGGSRSPRDAEPIGIHITGTVVSARAQVGPVRRGRRAGVGGVTAPLSAVGAGRTENIYTLANRRNTAFSAGVNYPPSFY